MSKVGEVSGAGPLSPYDYRDFHDFDSVSMRSSTIVDSEYAAAQIRRFERDDQFATPIDQRSTPNAINLQIQVLNNGNAGPFVTNPVDEILSRKSSKKAESFGIDSRRCKLQIVCIALLVIVISATAISLAIFFKNYNKNESTTSSPFESTSIPTTPVYIHPTSVPATTSIPTTTVYFHPTSAPAITTIIETTTRDPFEVISRAEWGAHAFKGTKKLKSNVGFVIVMDTQSEPCHDISDCITFVQKLQNLTYGFYYLEMSITDIRENFLIAPDGIIFEGRGFQYEGQHTFDLQRTSYNSNALGVSFIGNYSSQNLTKAQEEAFSVLIQRNIQLGKVSESYKLYHKEQLALARDISGDFLFKTAQTWDHWKKTPKTIPKEKWGGLKRKAGSGYFSLLKYERVTVGHSNGSSCDDLKSCSEILQAIQLEDMVKHGDIKYNFIFAGEDLIFQGRSFDLQGAATVGAMDVLFLGNFMDKPPIQSLMDAFEAFLQFAVDIDKLTLDYKLYGQRQQIENTSSPGDKLYEVLQMPPFDAHFDFEKSTPEPCWIGCKTKLKKTAIL